MSEAIKPMPEGVDHQDHDAWPTASIADKTSGKPESAGASAARKWWNSLSSDVQDEKLKLLHAMYGFPKP